MDYIPDIKKKMKKADVGTSSRICCLKSIAGVIPHLDSAAITKDIVPVLVTACTDKVPNIKFLISKIIEENKARIDPAVFDSQLKPKLEDMIKSEEAKHDKYLEE